MTSRTLWSEPFGMLMASGSPGSALAYQLGQAAFETELPRRNMIVETPSLPSNGVPSQSSSSKANAPSATSPSPSVRSWVGRVFDRLDRWSWRRAEREREAYLGHAQNVHDLENRMRHIDCNEFSAVDRALRLGAFP